MDWTRYWAVALSNASKNIAGTLGIVAGLEILSPSQVAAPLSPYSMAIIPDPELSPWLPSRNLMELYQLRDRLQAKIKRLPSGLGWLPLVDAENQQRLQTLQVVSARIQLEETARENWEQAQRLALQAVTTARLPQHSLATWHQAQTDWRQALKFLQAISSDSFLAEHKTRKITEYQAYLATAVQEAKRAESAFLIAIAQKSGLSAQAMITVCHRSGRCHHLRGNQPPNSPASLAKVPLAVALLQKTTEANIGLDTLIYIEPGNFTEDASTLRAGQRYPLRIVLTQMIDHSSNIAANQLIDYLGHDYINRVLQNRGYRITRINYKFMGEATMPANPGRSSNRLTSNELTRMMVQIYRLQHPQDRVLIQALKQQDDRSLGIAALQGAAAQWLGEKTGQNSQVLGTTLAVRIANEQ